MIVRKTAQHRYIRIDDVIYTSEAFSTLPPSAMKLWIDLRTQLNGFNNGRIDATMATLRKRAWTSPETLYRALRELMDRGLIARTRLGKPGPARICSLYRFTDLATPKDEGRFIDGRPATLEFRNWRAPAEEKIRATKIVSTVLRKSKRCRYEKRSVDTSTDTEIEARNNARTPLKPAPVLASG